MRSEYGIDDYHTVMNTIKETKEKLARLINTNPDRIAFVDNTSNGLNVLAQGIPWKHGDRVLLNDIEFPSNVYPFLNLKSQGVEVDFVKSSNGLVTTERIISAIKPGTRLISISQVQFLSGYRVDLKTLGEYCRQHNIILSVDAIQGLGALQTDVQDLNIDFLAAGTQKWMMGLMGLAFIFISEKLQEQLTPRYVGWTSVENTWELLNYDFVLKKTAEAYQNGTVSAIGVTGCKAALEVFEAFGIKNVEQRVLDNAEYFRNKLKEAGFTPVLGEQRREFTSGIVSFPSVYAKALFDNLTAARVSCSLREGMVRFSPHFYNTRDEIDAVIDILLKT